MISEQQLAKFMDICKSSGQELSREDAIASAIQLINLVKVTYQPMSKVEYEKTLERRMKEPKSAINA